MVIAILERMPRYNLIQLVRKVLAIALNREEKNINAYRIALWAGVGLNTAYLLLHILREDGLIVDGVLDLEKAKSFLEAGT